MIACNREPEGGHGIPSQPTISRLENVPDARTLYRIGIGYIDFFCRSYATPPTSIALDIDDTDDLVHGGQQLALFNTHAGGYCFQPIHIFEGKRVQRMNEAFGVDRRTVERWRRWWRNNFTATPFWQIARAAFMPPVEHECLPGSLIERFSGGDADRLIAMLRFLGPITGGSHAR